MLYVCNLISTVEEIEKVEEVEKLKKKTKLADLEHYVGTMLVNK